MHSQVTMPTTHATKLNAKESPPSIDGPAKVATPPEMWPDTPAVATTTWVAPGIVTCTVQSADPLPGLFTVTEPTMPWLLLTWLNRAVSADAEPVLVAETGGLGWIT